MFFEYRLPIPASTPAASPVPLDAPLCAGTVSRVDIQFPSGCAGLAHVSVWRSGHQVWPVNLDGDIAGEDAIISWPESYDLDDEPFGFILRGWNADDTYQHTITFRFTLLSLEEAQSARGLAGMLRRAIGLLLGRS